MESACLDCLPTETSSSYGQGRLEALDPAADDPGRRLLFEERRRRSEDRPPDIAARNLMEHVSDAARGVVPLAVGRRATRSWRDWRNVTTARESS